MCASAAWAARSSGHAWFGPPGQGPSASPWTGAPGTLPPSGCMSGRGFPSWGFEEDITRIPEKTRFFSPGSFGGRMSHSRMQFVAGKIVRDEGQGGVVLFLGRVGARPHVYRHGGL